MPSSPHLVIATAGHIDHGKTALIKALTGIETDRLEEEKRRGITIELGFAHLGDRLGIIDVPGHERFIKTMVAGVSAVDLGLLVVAADDGVMPQTREHLAILKLLGVPHLFVVITKITGLDIPWVDLVEADIRTLLPDHYQKTTRFFRCDSLSGEGIEGLKQALLGVANQVPPRFDSGVFRLPVDRAFSLKGYGSVVAGTILGGQVRSGDRLVILPLGKEVRVRGLQSQNQDQQSLGLGQRAALNLIGVDAGTIQRGNWICEPDAFLPADTLTVKVETLPEAPVLKNRDRVHFHLGTAEILGRVILFGQETVLPSGVAFAQITLETPAVAARGDRFIIRRYSPLQTWGGGVVLDPLGGQYHRSKPAALSFLQALDTADGVEALRLKIASREGRGLTWNQARAFTGISSNLLEKSVKELEAKNQTIKAGSGENQLLVSSQTLNRAREKLLEYLDSYHEKHPDIIGITRAHILSDFSVDHASFPPLIKGGRGDHAIGISPLLVERVLDDMMAEGLVIAEKGYLHRSAHRIHLEPRLESIASRLQIALEESGLNPPIPENFARQQNLTESEFIQIRNFLLQRSSIVTLENGSLWTAGAVDSAWDKIRSELSEGIGKSIGQLRDVLGCPRRQALTLLEHFDALGWTSRQGDLRFPGEKFNEGQ